MEAGKETAAFREVMSLSVACLTSVNERHSNGDPVMPIWEIVEDCDRDELVDVLSVTTSLLWSAVRDLSQFTDQTVGDIADELVRIIWRTP